MLQLQVLLAACGDERDDDRHQDRVDGDHDVGLGIGDGAQVDVRPIGSPEQGLFASFRDRTAPLCGGRHRLLAVDQRGKLPPQHLDVLAYASSSVAEEALAVNALEDLFTTNGALTFTAIKQVDTGMALRITANVDEAPDGGRLLAAVDYAPTVLAPTPTWNDARWTSHRAKDAFFMALEDLRHSGYDTVDFDVLVAVAESEAGE